MLFNSAAILFQLNLLKRFTNFLFFCFLCVVQHQTETKISSLRNSVGRLSFHSNNHNNKKSTVEQQPFMNVYYYKQLANNHSTDNQPSPSSRGLSDLDEVVQQSTSMQDSGAKHEIVEDKEKNILFFGFNQLNSLFAVGTEQGFYVYSTQNLKERTKMCKFWQLSFRSFLCS